MPRLPRDLSGDDLVEKLEPYGYEVTRQTGSHLRLTRNTATGEHHITVPKHKSLRVGTLNSILSDVAVELSKNKDSLMSELFGS